MKQNMNPVVALLAAALVNTGRSEGSSGFERTEPFRDTLERADTFLAWLDRHTTSVADDG